LGLDVDETLSPTLLEKGSLLGTILCSFPAAHEASEGLLERVLGTKRIERLTERVGDERVEQRDAETEAFQALPLVKKEAAPAGIKAPKVASIMPDGGRLQLCTQNEDSQTHWHEYKAVCLLGQESDVCEQDPCPDLPEMFLERGRIETLTREIGKKAADVDEEKPSGSATASEIVSACVDAARSSPKKFEYQPPEVLSRDVLATRRNSKGFGKMLAARAWSLGMFASPRKAYVGDGQNWIWRVWERWFKPFGFVGILDFIHALTYVFAAATAGRPREEGWKEYVRWITCLWQGEVAKVIDELAARQQELGLPTDADGATSVRRIVHEALSYLQNQSSKMNYPEYRRQGLPITSSHIESTVKSLNQRIKGSEKFWSERGAEALLQLKADTLSDTGHWDKFWRERPHRKTGTRHYARSKS